MLVADGNVLGKLYQSSAADDHQEVVTSGFSPCYIIVNLHHYFQLMYVHNHILKNSTMVTKLICVRISIPEAVCVLVYQRLCAY